MEFKLRPFGNFVLCSWSFLREIIVFWATKFTCCRTNDFARVHIFFKTLTGSTYRLRFIALKFVSINLLTYLMSSYFVVFCSAAKHSSRSFLFIRIRKCWRYACSKSDVEFFSQILSGTLH